MIDSTYLILKHFEYKKKCKNDDSEMNNFEKNTKILKKNTKILKKNNKVTSSFLKSIFGNSLTNVVYIDESKNEEYSFNYYSSDEDRSRRTISQDDITMINEIIKDENNKKNNKQDIV